MKDKEREKKYHRLKFEYKKRLNGGCDYDFEEWWAQTSEARESLNSRYPDDPILVEFEEPQKTTRGRKKKSEPRGLHTGYLFLKVRVTEPFHVLEAEFKKTMTEAKNIIEQKNKQLKGTDSRKYEGIRLGELERYLRVFDLKKQGKTTKEVIEALNIRIRNNDEEGFNLAMRSIKRDYQKARRIMQNLIKDPQAFPGKY